MSRVGVQPRQALFGSSESAPLWPVCDHYCGVEARMRKSLDLQAELGPVFDVTLDCEDGAPVGREAEHVRANRYGRVGVGVHPVDHPSFADDVATIVRVAGERLACPMLPRCRNFDDLTLACDEIDRRIVSSGPGRMFPIHALILHTTNP